VQTLFGLQPGQFGVNSTKLAFSKYAPKKEFKKNSDKKSPGISVFSGYTDNSSACIKIGLAVCCPIFPFKHRILPFVIFYFQPIWFLLNFEPS